MLLVLTALVTGCILVLSWRSKHLKKLEIVILWLLISNLLADAFDITTVNLGLLAVPHTFQALYSVVLLGMLLIPALITWMLDLRLSLTSRMGQWLLVVGQALVLFAMEYGADRLGILTHSSWNGWYLFSFWLLFLLGVVMLRMVTAKLVSWR